jgi:hypothetical protein
MAGIYLHGSACLGGWNTTSSDIDLLIVVEDGIDRASLEAMSLHVLTHARHCPGKGLECSIVTPGVRQVQFAIAGHSWPTLIRPTTPSRRFLRHPRIAILTC